MTTQGWRARLVLAALVAGFLALRPMPTTAAVLTENFDNVAALGASGWVLVNNSSPAGGLPWFQGNPGIFASQAGAPNSYIASNFNAAGALGGNISNWLILPELAYGSNDFLSFYTRSNGELPDRLEVRYSANGSSTNVGATDASVGDFTTLLLTINPALGPGYPTNWTQFVVSLAALSGTTGRLAFRYNVPNTNVNADYIGIDTVVVTPEPATLTLLGLGLLGLANRRWRRTRRERSVR